MSDFQDAKAVVRAYQAAVIAAAPDAVVDALATHTSTDYLWRGMHPFDIGTLLDKQGIAVRTGHHCTQPLMDFYQIPGTVRASFAFYNTKEEIDIFIAALERSMQILGA